jgi:hypothetical protein
MSTRVIIGVPTGILSINAEKIYHGDPVIAKAAHGYFTQYRNQKNVVAIAPSKAKRGFSSRRCPKNMKVYGFEIDNVEALKRWWYESN